MEVNVILKLKTTELEALRDELPRNVVSNKSIVLFLELNFLESIGFLISVLAHRLQLEEARRHPL